MIKQLFVVFDNKACIYGNPFTSPHQEVALRDFGYACQDQNSELSKFPDDFSLLRLGEFDDETAAFNLLPNPVTIALAVQFTRKEN